MAWGVTDMARDLDVLFDRNTSANGSHSVILPIYCGGITHELVQAKYPFLSTHIRLLYEDHKVDGIVKQMKLVLEKRKATASQHKPTSPVYRPHAHDVAPKDAVSELDIVCEVKTEEIGQVCTRPKNLAVDSENGQPINSSFTSASSPSKINGVLKSSGCKSSAKKTLRINPDPKVLKTEPLYRSVGVVNHCGHCGPMSSKYRAATIYTESQMDAEAELMEKIHQARIVGDSASESGGEDGDEDDGDEKLLGDPAKLNDLLSYPLSSLRFEVLRLLSIMMDPLAVVGTDFTHFAAQIGFCSTYIRYLKALDIKKNSPFEEVLQIWQDSAPDTTIGDLMYLLNEIRRKDVVYKLNEYYPILSDQ